ncbi:MAG: hypothetical protein ACLFOY_16755 [Desulfatibacillaceae bacterium]
MGEIKSTLDLVMEKTSGMSQSPEERESQRQEERLRKVNRLLNAHLRGELDKMALAERFEDVVATEPDYDWKPLLCGNLARTLAVGGGSNEKVLETLDHMGCPNAAPARELLESARLARRDLENELGTVLMADLAQRGISGSAIRPNPAAMPGYAEKIEEMESRMRERLSELAGA